VVAERAGWRVGCETLPPSLHLLFRPALDHHRLLIGIEVEGLGAVLLAYALQHSGSRLLFAQPSFKSSDYTEIVGSVRSSLPDLSEALFFGTEAHRAFLDRGTSLDAEELREREGDFDFDALVAMQYTSGTTGTPKAATLTHHNILNRDR
jgi:long-subunit acyl-CoA synthetase (AMP-forming)